jgi:hypothetical protein
MLVLELLVLTLLFVLVLADLQLKQRRNVMVKIVVKGKVISVRPDQWFNKDDQGNEIPGAKSILVSLTGGFSFRTKEGDDNYLDVQDYVRNGMVVSIECSNILPQPYQSTESTGSGAEVEVTRYFKNLEDPEIIDIEEPERKEKFAHLPKKDELVFAHREGRPRKQRRQGTAETVPEGAPEGTVY